MSDVEHYRRDEFIEEMDLDALRVYVQREMDSLGIIVNRLVSGHLNAVHAAPSRPREGDLHRPDGSNWDPTSMGPGIAWYGGTRWRGLFDKRVTLEAVSDPTKDDNGSLGYSIGSVWVNTSAGAGYMLVGMASANGSANWKQITV